MKLFWRDVAIVVGGAIAVVVATYLVNLWAFSCIPRLSRLLSLSDAWFLEGLLALVLGAILFLSAKPHLFGGDRMLLLESLHDDTEVRRDTAAVGLALMVACIPLFLLHFWSIH